MFRSRVLRHREEKFVQADNDTHSSSTTSFSQERFIIFRAKTRPEDSTRSVLKTFAEWFKILTKHRRRQLLDFRSFYIRWVRHGVGGTNGDEPPSADKRLAFSFFFNNRPSYLSLGSSLLIFYQTNNVVKFVLVGRQLY